MRRDVQEIFRSTPHEKQVMMFSATLSKEIRPVCKKFMQDVISPFHNLAYLRLEAVERVVATQPICGDSQRDAHTLALLSIESVSTRGGARG